MSRPRRADVVAAGGGRAATSHGWRRLLALLVVLLAALPFLVAADRVHLQVDDTSVAVRTYDTTVADVLAERGVALDPRDVVVPPLHSEVDDGTRIRVHRARSRSLLVQGIPREVVTAGFTVADVLDAAGLDVPAAHVSPPVTSVLADDTVVRVLVPLTVTVLVDGAASVVELPPGIVADALAASDVELSADDTVAPAPDVALEDGMTVHVTRRGEDRLRVEVEVPFETQEVATDELLVGEAVVVQEGRVGTREEVYWVQLVDGVEVDRELLGSTVVTEPLPRVVHVGTREPEPEPSPEPPPPPPPPQPSADDDVWYRLAECESGQRWNLDGTYDGGLQFHPDTWNRWKPDGYPDYAHQASAAQQIAVGKRLHAVRGWEPWPSCARRLGLL